MKKILFKKGLYMSLFIQVITIVIFTSVTSSCAEKRSTNVESQSKIDKKTADGGRQNTNAEEKGAAPSSIHAQASQTSPRAGAAGSSKDHLIIPEGVHEGAAVSRQKLEKYLANKFFNVSEISNISFSSELYAYEVVGLAVTFGIAALMDSGDIFTTSFTAKGGWLSHEDTEYSSVQCKTRSREASLQLSDCDSTNDRFIPMSYRTVGVHFCEHDPPGRRFQPSPLGFVSVPSVSHPGCDREGVRDEIDVVFGAAAPMSEILIAP